MTITISEHAPPPEGDYASISIAFEVREVFDVVTAPDGRLHLAPSPRPLAVPWVKDYDREPGGHPTEWAGRFDTSRWGVLAAAVAGVRVGGATIAWDAPEVGLLDRRRDVAVLWDIRVAPAARGRGVGTALFGAAERWAARRGARELMIETQTLNVPACRFYRQRGCELRTIRPEAYPELPDEVQLLWYRTL